MRFGVKPGDVPSAAAARRLGPTLDEFQPKLAELLKRTSRHQTRRPINLILTHLFPLIQTEEMSASGLQGATASPYASRSPRST